MMLERFDPDARTLIAQAAEHARLLGHRYVGGEHILLATVSAGAPASAVMRARGLTPELVEEEIVRRVGLGIGAGLFAGLDRDALATIGIDLGRGAGQDRGVVRTAGADQRRPGGAPGPDPAPGPAAAPDRARLAPQATGAAGPGPRAWIQPAAGCPGRFRPLLCSRAAAERAYPIHAGLEEDPLSHPARGNRHG
jgi:hypothetical protein